MRPTTAGRPPIVSLYAALIAGAVIVCYGNALEAPFVFDDQHAIVANTSIRSIGGALTPPPNSPTAGRPVVALTFALNYRAGGLDVRGYHLANVVIHLCTALLLFGVVRRTLLLPGMRVSFGSSGSSAAFAIALIWAVHPLATEAVDYITQRTESLMALMFVATLYASIRALDDGGGRRWSSAAVVACALGMACKETMVVAPLVVVLYDRTFVFNSIREAARRRWRLYAGLALCWVVLAVLVAPAPRSGSAGFSTGTTSWAYLLNQAVMIGRYLSLTVWPADLVITYGPPATQTLAQVWPEALLVIALAALTAIALVFWPAAGFLGACAFLMLAPSSSIVPIATEVGAERRMYLPLMALVAGSVASVCRIGAVKRHGSPVVGRTALVATATVLAALTIMRNREYASALTLAQTALARWPSAGAHAMVGTELAALGRDEEALPELRLGAAVDPRAQYNFGITLLNVKDDEAAIRELEAFAHVHPLREEVPLARRALGTAFARQGKWVEAVRQYRLALDMTPADPVTRRLAVSTLIEQGNAAGNGGRFADAASAFRQARDLDASSAIAQRGLAAALYDSGDVDGALAEARRGVATDPSDAASYDMIGRALASQGRIDEAVEHLQRALRLSPNDAAIQEDLARVRAARSVPGR